MSHGRQRGPDGENRELGRATKSRDSAPDLLVIQPVRDWTCAECRGSGDPSVDRVLASWS